MQEERGLFKTGPCENLSGRWFGCLSERGIYRTPQERLIDVATQTRLRYWKMAGTPQCSREQEQSGREFSIGGWLKSATLKDSRVRKKQDHLGRVS